MISDHDFRLLASEHLLSDLNGTRSKVSDIQGAGKMLEVSRIQIENVNIIRIIPINKRRYGPVKDGAGYRFLLNKVLRIV